MSDRPGHPHDDQETTVDRPPSRRRAAAALALLLALATGCSATGPEGADGSTGTASTSLTATTFTTPADTHADADDGDYSTEGATTIALADGASTVTGSGAAVDGDVVTITGAGTYVVSGTLTDGGLVVDSTGEGTVQVVLDGAHITSATTSPFVVTEADEAVVVLAAGTTSTLADAAASGADDEETDAPTATLFSMADLTIAGTGTLDVTGSSNDAIGSKDGLVVLSGTVEVTAADDGLRGKDYLVVEGGTVTVTAGGDGLKSDGDDAAEPGWFQLDGGTVTVEAGSDGVDAVGAVNVAAGTLTVTGSEEGLEARQVTLAGGTVDVTATDDGLNATNGETAGGGEDVQDGVLLTISGGDVHVAVAQGDGIDSNGDAIVTGGTTVVEAVSASGGGTGSLDVNGALLVTGGILVALGGVSTTPAADSSQGWVAASLGTAAEAGQVVAVVAADRTVVARYVVPRPTSSLVVAADGIEQGQVYELLVGDADGASGFSTGGSVDGLTSAGTVTAGESSARGGGPGQGGGRRGEPGARPSGR